MGMRKKDLRVGMAVAYRPTKIGGVVKAYVVSIGGWRMSKRRSFENLIEDPEVRDTIAIAVCPDKESGEVHWKQRISPIRCIEDTWDGWNSAAAYRDEVQRLNTIDRMKRAMRDKKSNRTLWDKIRADLLRVGLSRAEVNMLRPKSFSGEGCVICMDMRYLGRILKIPVED